MKLYPTRGNVTSHLVMFRHISSQFITFSHISIVSTDFLRITYVENQLFFYNGQNLTKCHISSYYNITSLLVMLGNMTSLLVIL